MYQAVLARLHVPNLPLQQRFSAVQAPAGSICLAATGTPPRMQPAVARPSRTGSFGVRSRDT